MNFQWFKDHDKYGAFKEMPKYRRGLSRHLNDREMQLVWELAEIHCSESEIAHALDFGYKTWLQYKEEHPEIQPFMDKAGAQGAAHLRRAQWDAAMHGNTTMMVWLGRAVLNQNQDVKANQNGTPNQLADISPEARQRLLELRDSIYNQQQPVIEVEAELTHVKNDDPPTHPGTLGCESLHDAEA